MQETFLDTVHNFDPTSQAVDPGITYQDDLLENLKP